MDKNEEWTLNNCKFAKENTYIKLAQAFQQEGYYVEPRMKNQLEMTKKIDSFAQKVAAFLKRFKVEKITPQDIFRAISALPPEYRTIMDLAEKHGISFVQSVNDHLDFNHKI